IEWNINLSSGNSRLVSSEIYFVTNDEMILTSNVEFYIDPGLRNLNTILGFAPVGTIKIEISLIAIGWSPLSTSTDSENIVSSVSSLALVVASDPNPLNPTLGDSVKISLKLLNDDVLELNSGKIIVIDGQKRVLGEYNSPIIGSGDETLIEIRIDEWMSTSTTSLEFIWIVNELLIKTSIEVVSSNSQEISSESEIMVDWFSLFGGIGIALLVIFSVRLISARNESESTETRSYSQKNKEKIEKLDVEKRSIECSACSKQLQVPVDYNGQVKCPSCLNQFSSKTELKPENNNDELFATSDNDVIGCPECDQVLRVPYEKRPAKARCPACKCIFNALAE
ncbi:MAG: hypothetical protein CMB64_07455, partial [Euryarchaeota archaeon]|nr:hypothetical protein [Euryarchaeota archaeon]